MFTNGIVARRISKLDRLLSQYLEWKEKAVTELLLNMLHSEFRTVYFPHPEVQASGFPLVDCCSDNNQAAATALVPRRRRHTLSPAHQHPTCHPVIGPCDYCRVHSSSRNLGSYCFLHLMIMMEVERKDDIRILHILGSGRTKGAQ